MSPRLPQAEREDPWAPYVPCSELPWDRRRVVHLHRRAGFAASWTEIERDLQDGPQASIARLLSGTARGETEDFARTASLLADGALASNDLARLKAWWIYRMLGTGDPLGERLTLVWHNHFATSFAKVQDVRAMWRQNETFRACARVPFGELLARSLREPALLVWLDAQTNRKEHPNENLARELMELFTLGVGSYGEADVKEAARALSGVTVSGAGQYRVLAENHDGGEKTLLGGTGRWGADDLVRVLLDQPATAQRVARRLCEMLLADGAIPEDAIVALADRLRAHSLDIGLGVATILRSQRFFAPANIGGRIVAPPELVVGAVCALERRDPPPSTLVLAEWVARLGQDLFQPPNVFGWPGGRAWITTATTLRRAQFGTALAGGELGDARGGEHALSTAQRHGRGRDLGDVASFYGELLLGAPPPSWCEAILARAGAHEGLEPAVVGRVVGLMLASPEVQVV